MDQTLVDEANEPINKVDVEVMEVWILALVEAVDDVKDLVQMNFN